MKQSFRTVFLKRHTIGIWIVWRKKNDQLGTDNDQLQKK
jgi:hypothetical protein